MSIQVNFGQVAIVHKTRKCADGKPLVSVESQRIAEELIKGEWAILKDAAALPVEAKEIKPKAKRPRIRKTKEDVDSEK